MDGIYKGAYVCIYLNIEAYTWTICQVTFEKYNCEACMPSASW
jgi:hypothetical protein